LIIRHGATRLNNEDVSVDRIRGWKDVPLSKSGREEAEKLGKEIAKDPPDHLLTSDLKRACQTAEIIAEEAGIEIEEVSQSFRPWNVGIYAGQLTVEAVPILADFACNKPNEALEDGESFNSFCARFFRGMAQAVATYAGVIAVVTHYRCERVLKAWIAAGCPEDGSIDIDTFDQKGEFTGGHELVQVPAPALSAAAEYLNKIGKARGMRFTLPHVDPRDLNGHGLPAQK
jgi:broad specificity phosphatase PhoE